MTAALDERPARGIPFRALVPNAITALVLCFGLTGVRFAIGEEWEKALGSIIVAGILDGLDGRVARLLRANSKFGAELDSLADNIAFGTAPALILFLWSLNTAPQFGWTAALALAVCCALRLARFNARIDAGPQPHKEAGFNTGVPAPVGAGLAFVPVYLWLITGNELFRSWVIDHAVDPVHRRADDLKRADLHLVVDPHSPRMAPVRAGRGGFAWRGTGDHAVDHLAGDLGALSRGDAAEHRQLRPGQAAARHSGCARSGRRTESARGWIAHADRAHRLRRLGKHRLATQRGEDLARRFHRQARARLWPTSQRVARKASVASGASMKCFPIVLAPNPKLLFKFRNGPIIPCDATMFALCSRPVKRIRCQFVLIARVMRPSP